MISNNLFAAVDIGASKVIVFVGASVRGELSLLGFAEEPFPGSQRGVILDLTAAHDALAKAFTAAERSAGAFNQVRRSYHAISGTHLHSVIQCGSAAVADRIVAAGDMARALADARAPLCEPGHWLIGHTRQGYRVDGRRFRASPEGRSGRRVEVECFRVEAAKEEILRLAGLSENLGAPAEELFPASLAAAQSVSTPEEREAGVLIVDIGASVTDFCVFSGGRILTTGVVPMGGDDVTLDLAAALRLRHDDAETIKTSLARAYTTPMDKRETVLFAPAPGVIGARKFTSHEVHSPVEARLTRLLTPIRDAVAATANEEDPPIRHAIFTGKASAQTGLDQLAARILGIRCERVEDREWKGEPFSDPRFSTAKGVLELAHRHELRRAARPPESSPLTEKLLLWYRTTPMQVMFPL